MKSKVSRAFAMAVGTAAFAVMTGQAIGAAQSQTPGSTSPATGAPASPGTSQAPTTSAPTATRGAAEQSMTLSGCIVREADFRRTSGAGKGGAVGTGVGTGNEFVLTMAMAAPAGSTATAGTSGAGAPSATGTSGVSNTRSYELTGPREGDAAALVGKRVEITGKVKATSSTAPGGPTANVPLSDDLQLSELEISSIKETTGVCPSSATP